MCITSTKRKTLYNLNLHESYQHLNNGKKASFLNKKSTNGTYPHINTFIIVFSFF